MTTTNTWGGHRPGAGAQKNNKNRLTHGHRVTNPNCPRCAGRLYEDNDTYGRFLSCLNCGHLIALDGYDPEGRPPRQNRGHRSTGALKGMTAAQRHPRA